MVEQQDGWFVVNVADAQWLKSSDFGRRCSFEIEGRFPEMGVNLAVLEPGKPACRYLRCLVDHRAAPLASRAD